MKAEIRHVASGRLLPVSISEKDAYHYYVDFVPDQAGDYLIHINWTDSPIPNSPIRWIQFQTPPPYIWHLYRTALSIPRHCNSEQCDLLTSLINLDLLPFRGFAKDTAIVKQTEESKLAKSAGGKSGKEYSATTTKTVTKSAAKSSAGEHSKVINNRLQGDR